MACSSSKTNTHRSHWSLPGQLGRPWGLGCTNCSPLALLTVSVCADFSSRAHRLKNTRLSFYQYTSCSLSCLPFPGPGRLFSTQSAQPTSGRPRPSNQSELAPRQAPAPDWWDPWGGLSGTPSRARARLLPAHPFICLHDKPGPLSLGRKLEDKHC